MSSAGGGDELYCVEALVLWSVVVLEGCAVGCELSSVEALVLRSEGVSGSEETPSPHEASTATTAMDANADINLLRGRYKVYLLDRVGVGGRVVHGALLVMGTLIMAAGGAWVSIPFPVFVAFRLRARRG